MDTSTTFDIWNIQKKIIAQQTNQIYFKERDVFFISMGKNIWWEQNGKWIKFARPVIIVKKFTNALFRWVALTTRNKEWKYYYAFDLHHCKWQRVAILSQIRLYDEKRLLSKIWFITNNDFQELKRKLTELFQ